MTDEPSDCGEDSAGGVVRSTRRTYMTLVGGSVALSGGTATAAGAGTLGGAVSDSAPAAGGGYGSAGYGAGAYGGVGELPALCPYTNEESVVDTDGLRDAIDDWRAGEIGTDLLRDVIDAWRTGDPVPDC